MVPSLFWHWATCYNTINPFEASRAYFFSSVWVFVARCSWLYASCHHHCLFSITSWKQSDLSISARRGNLSGLITFWQSATNILRLMSTCHIGHRQLWLMLQIYLSFDGAWNRCHKLQLSGRFVTILIIPRLLCAFQSLWETNSDLHENVFLFKGNFSIKHK